jgi:FkbM family methyltransferase
MLPPWIRKMEKDDDGYCVVFNDIMSHNDGDVCISSITHTVLKDASGVCIDVGADIGWWGLFCKYISPSSKVYAFEPNPKSFEKLQAHSDGTFHVYNTAVSEMDGDILMEFEGSNSNSRSNTGIKVKTQRLDFIFNEVDYVELIKIDTEGHDLIIVNSLERYFNKIRCIIFEFSVNWFGRTPNECVQNSLDALETLSKNYKYMYLVSRRGIPTLFRITDTDNFVPIIIVLRDCKIQIDIVCSVCEIKDVNIKDDLDFLKNPASIIYS